MDDYDYDNLWYEEKKLEVNLCFEMDESLGIQQIRSASFNQLIIFMTDVKEEEKEQQQQQQLWDDVILIHVRFTSSKGLFRKLIQRYNVPKHFINKEGDLEWRSKVQSRVLRFLLRWMETEPRDFVDKEIIKELTELTKTFQSDGWDVLTEEILLILQKQIEPLLLSSSSSSQTTESCGGVLPVAAAKGTLPLTPPPPFGSKVDKILLGLDETTFAEQLTLYDTQIYLRIQKREYVNQRWWSKPTHYHRCPNLRRWLFDGRSFSVWVAFAIISEQNFESRVEKYCKLVRIAFACFRLHNLNGAAKVFSGLEYLDKHLRLTKEAAPNEIKGMCEEMREIFIPDGFSYKTYQKFVLTIKPPIIPSIQVYFRDLMFLNEGSPDVNIRKLNMRRKRGICQVIGEVTQYWETVSFPFEEDSVIMECFENLSNLGEDQIRQRGLEIESIVEKNSDN